MKNTSEKVLTIIAIILAVILVILIVGGIIMLIDSAHEEGFFAFLAEANEAQTPDGVSAWGYWGVIVSIMLLSIALIRHIIKHR